MSASWSGKAPHGYRSISWPKPHELVTTSSVSDRMVFSRETGVRIGLYELPNCMCVVIWNTVSVLRARTPEQSVAPPAALQAGFKLELWTCAKGPRDRRGSSRRVHQLFRVVSGKRRDRITSGDLNLVSSIFKEHRDLTRPPVYPVD